MERPSGVELRIRRNGELLLCLAKNLFSQPLIILDRGRKSATEILYRPVEDKSSTSSNVMYGAEFFLFYMADLRPRSSKVFDFVAEYVRALFFFGKRPLTIIT